MKMTKEGNRKESSSWVGKCGRCEAEFEALESELKVEQSCKNGDDFVGATDCTYCKAHFQVYWRKQIDGTIRRRNNHE